MTSHPSPKPRAAIFGEPLIELSPAPASVLGSARLGVAGDTLNTAVYLSRLGIDVDYITAVGEDPYSDAIIEQLQTERIGANFCLRHPDRVPGLYAIRTNEVGERSFTYWRENSAAREFFELEASAHAIARAGAVDLFYFTGISLSILNASGQAKLLGAVEAAQRNGVKIAFDGNYRPKGWASPQAARQTFERLAPLLSICLPTSEDDDALFGPCEPVQHARRWRDLGAKTVVEKCGPDGAWILAEAREPVQIAPAERIKAIDTTGAGDSFNAGLLAGWISGLDIEAAAKNANLLAGTVIRHRGAIIPPEAMPPADKFLSA